MVVQHIQRNLNAMNFSGRIGNISSLQVQSLEKTSSESRANKAADDAVELSISNKMKKQVKGLESSAENAQESVSSAQTAEEALSKVQDMLQRMQECAVEASDETKSKAERDVIQSEIVQLSTEIDHIAETTKFNNTYLLKGTENATRNYPMAHDAGLQGKMTDGETKATFEIETLSPEDQVVIGGKEYTIAYPAISYGNSTDYASLASDYAQEENNARAEKNKYSFGSDEYNEWDRREAYCRSRKLECQQLEQANEVLITADKAYEYMQEELTAANNIGTTTKSAEVTKSVDEEQNKVTFTIEKGYAEVNAPLHMELHAGSDAETENKISVDVKDMSTEGLGLKGLNVSDETGYAARYAVNAIKNALTVVSEQKTAISEAKDKVENSVSNLSNVVENTDNAEKMLENAKKNILAQANEAMLAQANQMTQSVFALLQ